MTTLLVVMAYAIDTAIWYVHARHLQTQADAAAIAGAQSFQYPCTSGATTSGTTDYTINKSVNQYNGTGLTPSNSPTYNAQYVNKTAATPSYTYSSGTHNLIPELNQPNFANQSFPNDKSPLTGNALSGSPCTDGLVDVKLTESNVPSYIPAWLNPLSFITAPYINKEAEVEFETESQSNSAEPFVEPLPNPASETAQLVNEANGNAIGNQFTLNPVSVGGVADPTTVSGSITLPTTIPTSAPTNGDIGVEISPNTNTTYNSNGTNPPYGISFFHVWTDGASPPGPPFLEDAWVASSGTSTCPSSPTGASSSNFISSTSSTSIVLCANVVVPSGTTCSTLNTNNFSLQLTVNGARTATTLSASDCTGITTSGTNTIATWTFSQPIGSDSGGTLYSLGWQQTKNNSSIGTYTGCSPGNGNNTNPCQGTFGTMQQVFSGAYDSQTAQSSGSGTTLSVSITGSNGVISSESNASLSGQQITVTVHSMSFSPASCTLNAQNQCIITASNPVVLSFGGNQGNAALECNGNNGQTSFQNSVTTGCASTYQTTTGSCPNSDSPPSCASEDPGSKLNSGLDPGMTARVYCGESITTNCNVNKCPTTAGTNYNYWVPGNSLNAVLSQHPADPRLITVLITDNGGLGPGSNQNGVPIREFATFYVTGWDGAPCTSANKGGSGTAANGLAYAPDTDPTTATPTECDTSNGNGSKLVNCDGVLLGYFVQYLGSLGSGTGSGTPCGSGQLTPCVPVFIK